ncbi:hypothetical protein EJ06DRAFT_456273, partial [Trichodelitschia bisporula]
SYIQSAETTLHPGPPPKPAQARLALWPGLDVPKGLVQPIIVSSDEQCGDATPEHWCVFASMIVGNAKQEMGKRVALAGDQSLVMKFVYNTTLKGYHQSLFIPPNPQPVSILNIASGPSTSFYTATECQSKHAGTVNAHTYTETTIVLSEPDPNWGKTPTYSFMGCADSATTDDGGKTWKIGTIHM